MTLKEQLFQELDNVPDHILEQLLNSLRRLKTQPTAESNSNDSLSNLIGQAKGTFATPEEVDRFIRQERDTWDS
jgi:hypothetical protein